MLDDPFGWTWRVTRQASAGFRRQQAADRALPPARCGAPRARWHLSGDGLECRWQAPHSDSADQE
jgi:hypothetical protein